MMSPSQTDLNAFMSGLEKRNPGEPEFQQAVREVADLSSRSSRITGVPTGPHFRADDRARPSNHLPRLLGG